jgi:general nucleoside transport system permease protein
MIEILQNIMVSAVLAGGVLLFTALGETLSQRVGVMNLGIEGLIAIGAVTAALTAFATGSAWLGFVLAALVGIVFGIVFGLATVIIRANQILCGFALTFIGLGLASTLGNSIAGRPVIAEMTSVKIPLLGDIPIIGPAFFDQTIPGYVAYFLLPALIHFVLFRSRHGLNLRSVGEAPGAADAAGISVARMRFLYVCVGAALTAIAGAYLVLIFIPAWSDGLTAGRGWIAFALVIFARHRPFQVTLGALLFGTITALGFAAQALNWPISPTVLSSLPYVFTVLVLILPVLGQRQSAGSSTPAALGLPYFREKRS